MLFTTLEKSEWVYLNRTLGNKACWDAICDRHQNQGPIHQVAYLQEAMAAKCSRGTPLPVTAEKSCSEVDHAYDMGDISRDLMKCILLLNSLSDFPHTRAMVSWDISSSSEANPITSTDIQQYMDDEQSLWDSYMT